MIGRRQRSARDAPLAHGAAQESRVDAGFDPSTGDAFASNADGTLTVIHEDSPDTYHLAQTLTTMQGSRNMGLDATRHAIFLAGAKFEPPPAGATAPRRPAMVPASFVVLVVERK